MIRIILVAIFFLLYSIISLILYPAVWLIGKFNKKAKDKSSLFIVKNSFKVVRFLSGTRTTVIGYDRIPKDEPVLFVGNHKSYFDIVISYSLMPGLTGFVAKKELKKVPVISWWMRNLYCLFLDRNDTREGLKTILEGIDYIKKGISIVIFPEGTTSHTLDLLPFKEGSFKFAEKTGCKIIPMVQNNTRACFENQFPRIKKAHTIIEFGEPIDIKSLPKEERKFIGNYVRDIINEIQLKNEELV